MQDSHGNIWIATKGDGIILAEKEGTHFKFTRFKYDEDDIYSLSHNSVYWLHEDKYGRIWVATFGGGLNYIQKTPEGKYVFISSRNNLKGFRMTVVTVYAISLLTRRGIYGWGAVMARLVLKRILKIRSRLCSIFMHVSPMI